MVDSPRIASSNQNAAESSHLPKDPAGAPSAQSSHPPSPSNTSVSESPALSRPSVRFRYRALASVLLGPLLGDRGWDSRGLILAHLLVRAAALRRLL